MDKTTLHITEYRGEQLIDFFGITSFKVQNHGESVVEINTIPIYPGKTVKIIEEDSTQCDFTLHAKFTEEGKMPKFRAIYKQFGNADCYPHLHPELVYTVTLYNYEQGDVIDFSQNISGHTILTRSFDGGVTFPPENDIDLGFVEANQIVKYDLGGSLETNAIQFRNDDLEADSEIFMVGNAASNVPCIVHVSQNRSGSWSSFSVSKDSEITISFTTPRPDVSFDYPLGLIAKETSVDFPWELFNPVSHTGIEFIDTITGVILEKHFSPGI